jgi:hypothetical protein
VTTKTRQKLSAGFDAFQNEERSPALSAIPVIYVLLDLILSVTVTLLNLAFQLVATELSAEVGDGLKG